MHILLLTHFYPPEIRTISSMMRDCAETCTARGHTVTVFTTYPTENMSGDDTATVSIGKNVEKGVTVFRLRMPSFRRLPYILRGFVQVLQPYVYWRAIRRAKLSTIDAVIVYTPPLSLARVGEWVKKRYGARYLLNVQDIFPQNAIDLGILRNPIAIRFFMRMEQHAYRVADRMSTHTEGGRQRLIREKHIPSSKIITVPNWVNLDAWKDPVYPTISFRTQYGLEKKFIFFFPGIFGPSQHIDFLLDSAKALQAETEVVFLFVGDGVEKPRLVARVENERMTNVVFAPFVSPRWYPALVSEMDVGVMSLSPKNQTAVVPGKLVGFMAAKKPIVAFLQKESAGHRIIANARCGWSLPSDNTNDAVALFKNIIQNRGQLQEYGQNGYDYVLKHFTKDACIALLLKHFL